MKDENRIVRNLKIVANCLAFIGVDAGIVLLSGYLSGAKLKIWSGSKPEHGILSEFYDNDRNDNDQSMEKYIDGIIEELKDDWESTVKYMDKINVDVSNFTNLKGFYSKLLKKSKLNK